MEVERDEGGATVDPKLCHFANKIIAGDPNRVIKPDGIASSGVQITLCRWGRKDDWKFTQCVVIAGRNQGPSLLAFPDESHLSDAGSGSGRVKIEPKS